jgi:hypothetical protein
MRLPRSQDCLRRGDTLHRRDRLAARHPPENLLLLLTRRVADVQLEHEAVHLRFRQRIGAFLLDRVLRGEDEERLLQLVGRSADGDLLLLHRFEQCGLYLRRRALISSARMMLAKIGPFFTRTARCSARTPASR